MYRQFSKKTIFLKFISGSVLFSFIFTGITVRGYADTANFYSLRRPAAIDRRLIWEEDLRNAQKAKQIEVHQFAKEVLKDLPPESTILSLGSGSGIDEIFFAKAGHTVVATDFVESAIKELNEKINQEKIENLRTKVQNLTKTFDFPDESFDVVYSHLSLNFMTDAEIAKAIKEIYRVLKPGGRLYLIAQSVEDKTRSEGEEIEKDTIIRGGKLVHYFSKEYIKERFVDFEFKDEDIATGERIFYPPEGRVIGFIQLKAKKPIFRAEELALLDAVKKAQDALPGDVNEQNLNFIVQVDKEGKLLYPLSPEAKIIIGHIRDDRAAYFARGLQKRWFKNLIGYIKFAKDFEGKYVLPEEIVSEVPNTFFERLSNKGYTSVKISEDEKKSHTADNANGRRKSPFKGERRVVIEMQKSKKAYVDTPQMKMKECADAVLSELDGDVDFILVNLLSSDMMKHTGSFGASVKGNQITDSQLGRIKEKIEAIKQNILKLVESEITNIETGKELKELLNDDYDKFLEKLKTVNRNVYNNVRSLEARVPMLIVTADHGASEDGLKANQKESDTFHTANPVPYIIYDPLRKKKIPLKSDKTIINNAATLLHLLGEDVPSTYEESLLPDDYKGSKRRMVFCVLDGWGINPDRNYPYDAIRLANVPNYNWLVENASFTQLKAHGEIIGLRSQLSYEEGPHHLKGLQAGQTDIGHLHLFSGRQIKQPLWYVDNLIKGKISEGMFDESKPEVKVLIDELNEAKDKNLKVFYIAVASEGGVHSSLYHMYALMRLAKKLGLKKDQFIIIPAADGRDVPSRTAHLYLQDIFTKINEIGIGVVSGVFGRDMLVRKEGMEHITNRIIDVFSGNELDKPDVIRAGLLNFFDANSRFFQAIGGKELPGYLEGIKSQYESLQSKLTYPLNDVELVLAVHSSFFRKGGAIDVLNEIIKLPRGQQQVNIRLCIYGEGADKIRVLFGDNSNIITAKTAGELELKLKDQKIKLPEDVVVLKPIGEKIDWDVKQVGFSEKTISSVAVAKAMQVLLGANSEGKSYSGVILNKFKEFYENMKNQGVISNETYENSKTQVFDGLDLPDLELAPAVYDATKNDADTVYKFIDTFI